jgi:hypothetical protein
MDLAKDVTCRQSYRWDETEWAWPNGFGRQTAPKYRVVAMDYGAKRNILRCLASAGCDVVVLPATASAEDIFAQNPDGVFLSNGPGDPAATGQYAVTMIRGVLKADLPLFGICLGHQMLALALGMRARRAPWPGAASRTDASAKRRRRRRRRRQRTRRPASRALRALQARMRLRVLQQGLDPVGEPLPLLQSAMDREG